MPGSLNLNTTWRESLCVCLCFSVIGFINVGLHKEERSAFVAQLTWELKCQLALNENQTKKIMEINYEYYDMISGLNGKTIPNVIRQKNKQILKILNQDQQLLWLKNCGDGMER